MFIIFKYFIPISSLTLGNPNDIIGSMQMLNYYSSWVNLGWFGLLGMLGTENIRSFFSRSNSFLGNDYAKKFSAKFSNLKTPHWLFQRLQTFVLGSLVVQITS